MSVDFMWRRAMLPLMAQKQFINTLRCVDKMCIRDSYFRGYWNSLQPKIADGTFIVRNSDVAMEYKDIYDLTHEQL